MGLGLCYPAVIHGDQEVSEDGRALLLEHRLKGPTKGRLATFGAQCTVEDSLL